MIRKLETIVLAAPTVRINRIYPAYKAFYERFCAAAVPFHPIKTFALPDVWVRDFLPVQNRQTGKLYQPFFNPCYANYTFVFTSVIRQAAEKWLPAPSCEVQIDGGNMIWGPNQTLFCLERPAIFRKSVRGEQGFVEYELKRATGAKKIVWLPRGIYNDETNEHIDNVCAYVATAEVVLAWTDDETDPQYPLSKASLDALEAATDAKGRKFTVHKLPIPKHPVCVTEDELSGYEFEEGEDTREAGERLAASYVNFYISNGGIILPQFGDEHDAEAVRILGELFPTRKVYPIPARTILVGGGNIHCVTQQIPK